MEDKKNKNYFLRIMCVLFIIYFSLYLMDNLGYYNISAKKSILTEERLKEFESDVKNGKEIDIKSYIVDSTNYKNAYSNFGYNISMGIDKVLNKGLKNIGGFLSKLLK